LGPAPEEHWQKAGEPSHDTRGDCGNLWLRVAAIHYSFAGSEPPKPTGCSQGRGFPRGSKRGDWTGPGESSAPGLRSQVCVSPRRPQPSPDPMRPALAVASNRCRPKQRRGEGSQLAPRCVLVPGHCAPKDRRSCALWSTQAAAKSPVTRWRTPRPVQEPVVPRGASWGAGTESALKPSGRPTVQTVRWLAVTGVARWSQPGGAGGNGTAADVC
jgi:hypothetical protein